MRPCFAFKAAATADAPETLSIYDEIGFWGVQAKDFMTALGKVQSKELKSTRPVAMCSPHWRSTTA